MRFSRDLRDSNILRWCAKPLGKKVDDAAKVTGLPCALALVVIAANVIFPNYQEENANHLARYAAQEELQGKLSDCAIDRLLELEKEFYDKRTGRADVEQALANNILRQELKALHQEIRE